MNIVFETPRLILRQFTKDDSKLILQLNSDPEIVKYVHEPILTELKDDNLGRWATYTKNNNEFIGWCGLKYRAELDEIDLGYRLIKKAWGMGFATEAAKHTLDHGISKLNIDLITGRAHVENIASIKVLEKIGMQFIGEGIIDDCPVRTYTASKPSNQR